MENKEIVDRLNVVLGAIYKLEESKTPVPFGLALKLSEVNTDLNEYVTTLKRTLVKQEMPGEVRRA